MARYLPLVLGDWLRFAWTTDRENMAEPVPAGTNGFSTTRVFDAPRERVWQEWTEPEAFADWFGGMDCEIPLSTVEMDVRPGGRLRATMFCGLERRVIRWRGEYREVAPPERLIFKLTDKPGEDRYELITVLLTDLGDGRTEMHFEQRGPMRPDEYEYAKQGWGSFFARLDERLAAAG